MSIVILALSQDNRKIVMSHLVNFVVIDADPMIKKHHTLYASSMMPVLSISSVSHTENYRQKT